MSILAGVTTNDPSAITSIVTAHAESVPAGRVKTRSGRVIGWDEDTHLDETQGSVLSAETIQARQSAYFAPIEAQQEALKTLLDLIEGIENAAEKNADMTLRNVVHETVTAMRAVLSSDLFPTRDEMLANVQTEINAWSKSEAWDKPFSGDEAHTSARLPITDKAIRNSFGRWRDSLGLHRDDTPQARLDGALRIYGYIREHLTDIQGTGTVMEGHRRRDLSAIRSIFFPTEQSEQTERGIFESQIRSLTKFLAEGVKLRENDIDSGETLGAYVFASNCCDLLGDTLLPAVEAKWSRYSSRLEGLKDYMSACKTAAREVDTTGPSALQKWKESIDSLSVRVSDVLKDL